MNTVALIALTLLGKFSSPHQVSFLSYASQEACEADKGKWDGDLCVFDSEDSVEVSKVGAKFKVEISTVTTNAHSCDFKGTGVLKSKNVILATAPTGEAGQSCTVRLAYAANGSVSVATLTERACSYMCGANARLDISNAKRKQ